MLPTPRAPDLQGYGVPTPKGKVVTSPSEAQEVAAEMLAAKDGECAGDVAARAGVTIGTVRVGLTSLAHFVLPFACHTRATALQAAAT